METRSVSALKQFSPAKMQKVNLFETDHFFCDIYCLEPGQEQTPHGHAGADKVYYVLEGEGIFRVGEETQKLSPQSAVFAPPGVEHGVKNEGPAQLVLLVFMSPNPNRPA
jgi:quercetin dioxygenase-like cupin family protein